MTGYFSSKPSSQGSPQRSGWTGAFFLNAHYDADVSPPDWNCVGTFRPFEGGPSTEGDDQYARPSKEARYVWFFFLIDFDYMAHHGPDGRGDEDYVRNRVCRLTLDLATGDARTEK